MIADPLSLETSLGGLPGAFEADTLRAAFISNPPVNNKNGHDTGRLVISFIIGSEESVVDYLFDVELNDSQTEASVTDISSLNLWRRPISSIFRT